MITKGNLIEYLEKKILWLEDFKDTLPKSLNPFVMHIDNEIKDFRFVVEILKNLNEAIVKQENECVHPFEKVISAGALHNCTVCGQNIEHS